VFDMHLSWWEFPLRATLVYLALFLMVRLSGKRTVGQFTPFDLLVVMLLSESVSSSLSGGDDSVPAGLLLAASLMLLNALMAFFSTRSQKLERLLEGHPVLIGRDGQWFDAVLKRHRLGTGEVEQALREADTPLADMKLAMLESDGSISIVSR
jgi:uncharacterized membrane protein YcaP (DUF421 family)